VAVPTETVYGLAADAANPDAVAAVFAAKQRPADHPLIVHVAGTDDLSRWSIEVPDDALRLADAFWPGPLTLLLKKAPDVTPLVSGGLETIGIRAPGHPVLHRLLQKSGLGLAAPSANPYKQLSPTSALQVLAKLDGEIDAVLDGGECSIGLESTIVDLSTDDIRILRVGPVLPSEISQVLGKPVSTPEVHHEVVPGNVDQHYQPATPLRLLSRSQMVRQLQLPNANAAFVVLADFPDHQAADEPEVIIMPAAKTDFAKALYKTLHDLDECDYSVIWFEIPPQSEEWLDVNDRLRRASHAPRE